MLDRLLKLAVVTGLCLGLAGALAAGPARAQADIPGNKTSTVTLAKGTARASTMDFVGDADWFKLTLNDANSYQITTTGPAVIRIYRSNGTPGGEQRHQEELCIQGAGQPHPPSSLPSRAAGRPAADQGHPVRRLADLDPKSPYRHGRAEIQHDDRHRQSRLLRRSTGLPPTRGPLAVPLAAGCSTSAPTST